MPQSFTAYPGARQTHRLNYNVVSPTGTSRTAAASEVVNALYIRSALAGPASDTTPTASAIVGMIDAPVVNSSFEWIAVNNDPANDLTIVAGAGVTINGATTVGHAQTRRYIGYVTSLGLPTGPIAVTLQSVGAAVQ